MNTASNLYESTDFNLVVCAKTAGINIVSSEKKAHGQVVWYLTRSEFLERFLREYFSGNLSLPVQALFYNQKLIRSQIYS